MIEFRNISKRFGEAQVLRDVSFSVEAGKTLGLVGENGAGKSTLMNIVGGNVRADSGEMRLETKSYSPRSSRDAAQAGIAFIHQELNLFSNLTVAENLFLTRFPRRGGVMVNKAEMHRQSERLIREAGLDCAPDTGVEQLSPGQRQLVEVAKALGAEARLIIFDEPTTSLSAAETQVLFGLIDRLHARGISMIYISHALEDVLRLSNQVVILRDGVVAGSGPREAFTCERMVSLMVGRDLTQFYPAPECAPGKGVLLEAKGITQPGIVRDVSFSLHQGEVLGVAGLMGAGRSELARILFGLDPCQNGEITLAGRSLSRLRTRDRIRAGMAFVTEDRRDEGLCVEAAIADNIALVSLPKHARNCGLLDMRALAKTVSGIRQAVRLTASAGDEQPVKTLSGGNQQKVVLAKWLLAQPRVMILDEPTRGIDVGAKYEIYQLIRQAAAQGSGILVISSELEELMGLCDRVLVMSRGEIRDELRRDEFDRERIMRAALRVRHPSQFA